MCTQRQGVGEHTKKKTMSTKPTEGLVAGEWQQQPLKDSELRWVVATYDAMMAAATQLGVRSQNHCLTLKKKRDRDRFTFRNDKGQKIDGGPPKLRPSWIAFARRYEQIPKRNHGSSRWGMSHQCGEEYCIGCTHIHYELIATNNGRKICHALIRRYEYSKRRDKSVVVQDFCTVDGVRADSEWGHHDPCPHRPPCFVNFGDAESERKKRVDRPFGRLGPPLKVQRLCRMSDVSDARMWKTVYFGGNKGWVRHFDADGEAIFYRRTGSKKADYEERTVHFSELEYMAIPEESETQSERIDCDSE